MDYDELDYLLMLEEKLSQSRGEIVRQQTSIDGESDKKMEDIVERQNFPYVGQLFETEIAAYDFYNQHAALRGFGIRRNRSRKDKNGLYIYRNVCCSKEGNKQKRDPGKEPQYVRRERRSNCKAFLDVELNKIGMWEVTRYNDEHNHELLNVEQSFTLISHRGVKGHWKSIINVVEAVGIQPHQTYDYMVEQSGGFQNLGFLPGDHYNFISAQRRTKVNKGDAAILTDYLNRKKSLDKGFCYDMQLDTDLVVTNFFWADGRSLLDYGYFGDVVCFDTTYKTNNYGCPLGVFVSINHHRHTCLFGAAMLYDESKESCVVVFNIYENHVRKETNYNND